MALLGILQLEGGSVPSMMDGLLRFDDRLSWKQLVQLILDQMVQRVLVTCSWALVTR